MILLFHTTSSISSHSKISLVYLFIPNYISLFVYFPFHILNSFFAKPHITHCKMLFSDLTHSNPSSTILYYFLFSFLKYPMYFPFLININLFNLLHYAFFISFLLLFSLCFYSIHNSFVNTLMYVSNQILNNNNTAL